ncbi:MAG TPA: ABC transporter permease [Planctomycetota bacterium]|nr:ABC transporter permease [Planctomycetota bacterium]
MSETTKALFKDALYQVLDNKVFRLLVILVAVLVLPTFLIAAKPDRVVLFFGAYEYEYAKVFEWFGNLVRPANPEDAAATVIQGAQQLLVDGIAGTFGLIFAVAATAFFVPQMVEKGAADTVFSKPVARSTLFLSRYFAGILFVAILASVLVGGMFLGFLVNSGYSDTGFLWSVPVVIYKYAVLHALSLLVAVLTRSSIAAILTTLMFFAFNSCVHVLWQVKDMAEAKGIIAVEAGLEPDHEDDDDMSDVPRALIVTLDTLHYTLPKTNDASVLSQRLRKALGPAAADFRDPVSKLEVTRSPKGFTLEPSDAAVPPVIATWKQDEGAGLITLRRWGNKERKRIEARKEFDAALAARGVTDVKEGREAMLGTRTEVRRWHETVDGVSLDREARFFSAAQHWFQLDYDFPAGWRSSGEQPHELRVFEWSFRQEGQTFMDPSAFFEHNAGWTGELKYNLWFSIASTLAWIAVVLGISCWRLSRVDF